MQHRAFAEPTKLTGMKVIKTVLVVLGLLVVVAGMVMLGQNALAINEIHAAASANRSSGFLNPMRAVIIMVAVVLAGGILLGVGLTLPRRRRDVDRPGDDRLPAVKPHGVTGKGAN